jgi:hypothetical protein
MLCLDASTAQIKYRIPPKQRIRVKRERLRRAMLEDLPVEVSNPQPTLFFSANFGMIPSGTNGLYRLPQKTTV